MARDQNVLNSAVPESLRLEHREAHVCFEAGAYTAAIVMVRRTLEGVLQRNGDHQEATGGWPAGA